MAFGNFGSMHRNGGIEVSNMYDKIEKLCNSKGVNVTRMCKEAGVPRGNLSDLKMGRSAALSAKNLGKISAYFNVPIESLLSSEPMSIIDAANSVVLQGNTGNNSVNSAAPVAKADDGLNDQEVEILRIFRSLDMRKKTSVMSYFYDLEDSVREVSAKE